MLISLYFTWELLISRLSREDYLIKVGINIRTFRKLIILTFVFTLLIPLIANANGAKPMENPSGNGGLIFDENPGVALSNESITFRVLEADFRTEAKVTVEYELKNLLNQDQSFKMFFVVPPKYYSNSELWFKVLLDGVDITGPGLPNYKSITRPDNWLPKLPEGFIEPYSKRAFHNGLDGDIVTQYRVEKRKIEGIDIPISIKANSTAKLTIEYDCDGGYYNSDEYEKTIYSYIYFLTPARFWNGEPKVKLNVILPSQITGYRFYSNIPMKKAGKNHYSTELNKLPDHEWAFTFVNSKGLIYGTNSSKLHTNLTIAISILIFFITFVLYKRKGSNAYIVMGYILSIAYLFIFMGKIVDGYIMDTFIWMLLFFVLIIIVPFSYLAINKHASRNISNS